jgi:hypothetical protein
LFYKSKNRRFISTSKKDPGKIINTSEALSDGLFAPIVVDRGRVILYSGEFLFMCYCLGKLGRKFEIIWCSVSPILYHKLWRCSVKC